MAIRLPPLPFGKTALSPLISERTLEIHHDKHHAKYVQNTNDLVRGTEYEDMELEQLILITAYHLKHHEIEKKILNIFNNSAQAWNHAFYWNCLHPQRTKPLSENMKSTLAKNFGSYDQFSSLFKAAGKSLFGSGWVWLAKDEMGKLSIVAAKNAQNPMTEDKTPLLVCDVWEHAYYLDCQNDRSKYLENFFQLINWDFVEQNLDRPHLHYEVVDQYQETLVYSEAKY
ncbi:MAG: superoxide dismutase [Fe] [Bdellovibrio sp. CG10_big_fil_rev_8_21_14_0_10_47_8]|nr:MAG: superoxide dismutase [Fe] [Bdellovibrio sp. CG10_big_fil_rev_8_21_14_0_10_47_8]